MKKIKRTDKYLAYAAAMFIGAASARLWGVDLTTVAAVLGVVSVLLFLYYIFVYKKKILFSAVAVILSTLLGASGVLLGSAFLNKAESLTEYNDGNTHRITGCISDILYESSYYNRYTAELYTVDGTSASANAVIETVGESSLEKNSVFIANGTFSELSDYEKYLRADGIFAVVECDYIDVGATKKASIFDTLSSFRDTLSYKLRSSVGGQAGALCSALVLGDRSGLSDTVKLDFRYAGASHILAISGMHFSVIMAALNFVLQRINKLKRLLILIPAALAYMAFVGFSESVMRAAFMLTLLYLSVLLGQTNDSLTSLIVAVALIIVIKPYSAYDIGLWLSFFATFGIVVIIPELNIADIAAKGKKRITRLLFRLLSAVLSLLAVTAAAYFFTIPLVSAVYGGTSAAFLLTAVTVLPLSEAVLIMALLSVLTMYIPFVGAGVCYLTYQTARLLLLITGKIADIDGIYISLDYPFTPYIIYITLAVILIMLLSRRVKTVFTLPAIAAAFAVFIVCVSLYSTDGKTDYKYAYITQNNNDAVCIISDGRAVLVDASSGKGEFLTQSAEYFSDNHIGQIDCLVFTHLHADHTSAVKKLMAQTKIKSIYVPSDDGRTSGSDYATALDGIKSIVGGECTITVYNADIVSPAGKISVSREYIKTSTHPTVEFEIAGTVKYLGTHAADISSIYNADYHVLILGAHGPKQSNEVSIYSTDSDTVLIGNAVKDIYTSDSDKITEKLIYVDGIYENSASF